jgi:succinate dehydrogenase hydrophobic anchor subunit
MKSYTFKEYKQLTENKYSTIEKCLNILKKDKKEYKKLVIIAILMHKGLLCYAATTEAEVSTVATQILSLLMIFAKYGCMCMGIKSIIENALQGANFRQATNSGIQYFLIYILLTFYPKLFTMIKL